MKKIEVYQCDYCYRKFNDMEDCEGCEEFHSNLDELIVTDTIPLTDEAKACTRIRQLSMAPLLAEAIRRVCNEESISAMFDE